MDKKPGDWNCRACEHLNFGRRDFCQKCGGSRSEEFGFAGSDVRPGDWYCNLGSCGAHNFKSRSSCYRCGAPALAVAAGILGGRSGWKSGDWLCTRIGCNEHNYASRLECYRCGAPKDCNLQAQF